MDLHGKYLITSEIESKFRVRDDVLADQISASTAFLWDVHRHLSNSSYDSTGDQLEDFELVAQVTGYIKTLREAKARLNDLMKLLRDRTI